MRSDDFWLNEVEAAGALERGDGEGVAVAVIDSGVDFTHPRLAGIVRRDDLIVVQKDGRLGVEENTVGDCFGHGTAVAGIVYGVAARAGLGSFRVLGLDHAARSEAVRFAAIAAIERGYRILNVSMGCSRLSQVLVYKDWVDRAYLSGVHVVAACNNDNYRRTEWPGHFTSVNTVNFINRGDGCDLFRQDGSLVEFACAGVKVDVPWLDHGMKIQTGSSFAAPHVTGLLARILSVFPEIGVLQAKALLRKLARPAGNLA